MNCSCTPLNAPCHEGSLCDTDDCVVIDYTVTGFFRVGWGTGIASNASCVWFRDGAQATFITAQQATQGVCIFVENSVVTALITGSHDPDVIYVGNSFVSGIVDNQDTGIVVVANSNISTSIFSDRDEIDICDTVFVNPSRFARGRCISVQDSALDSIIGDPTSSPQCKEIGNLTETEFIDCDSDVQCITDVPTTSPTNSPTISPTTNSPTTSPTLAPTAHRIVRRRPCTSTSRGKFFKTVCGAGGFFSLLGI